MGHLIIQRIYTCDICGKTPEDGEKPWHMGNEVWCEEGCKKVEEEDADDETSNNVDTKPISYP